MTTAPPLLRPKFARKGPGMSNEAIRPFPPQEGPTLAQIVAAKKHGQEHGYTARANGWIHNNKGRPIAPDWRTYASYLIAVGIKAVRDATEEA
jgi:hypothetical protein